MRRQGPLMVVFVLGVVLGVQYFIPHGTSMFVYRQALDWAVILANFAFFLALGSVLMMHGNKIKRRRPGWGYNVVTLVSLFLMAVTGLVWGRSEGLYPQLYNFVMVPVQATMMALLAFYIASAAYRAFRARTVISTILLVTAIIVMLGRVPIGAAIWKGLPDFAAWILDGPNMAAKRAIQIGVGLGMLSTALKIIVGIERSYLGGAGE
jgi:hypothetical protein